MPAHQFNKKGVNIMLRWQKKILRSSYIILDCFALALSLPVAIGLANRFLFQQDLPLTALEHYTLITVMLLSFLFIFIMAGLYDSYMSSHKPLTIKLALKTVLAYIMGHFLSYGLLLVLISGYPYSFHLIYSGSFALLSTLTKLLYHMVKSKAGFSSPQKRNVLVIGLSPDGERYIETIRRHAYLNYNIVGFVHIKQPVEKSFSSLDLTADKVAPLGFDRLTLINPDDKDELLYSLQHQESVYRLLSYHGELDDIKRILNDQVIDEVVITRPLSYDTRLKNTLEEIQKRGITATLLLNQENNEAARATVTMVDNIPALKIHTVSLHEGQLAAKRIMDVACALVGMVLFGLAWLVFAPLIKLESKGPVIFKQERVSKNGRVFKMWKFRSMFEDAEARKKTLEEQNEMKGHMFKITDDPRVTRVGHFIRKTNIDELPQFYNVLRGDMSLVGTRPPTVEEVRHYEARHYKRISMIPGITGIWQASGGASLIRDFEDVVQLDTQYIKEWSVWKDVVIVFKTALIMGKLLKPRYGEKQLELAVPEKHDSEQALLPTKH